MRQAIIDLVGGIPKPAAGPVVAKRFGTVDDDGFRIENVAYESVPGYWVTANVYVPAGKGPFPALVVAPGHGAGKASQYAWAANFARAGFLTLAIDPMGQGERMQHFDPELGTSKVEPSGEHEHANQSALLVGQHIARYWFADGVRSVDYLTQRADVDAARIGTFGCSGGGTAAAYLAAMDPRVKAAAIASFITSFKTLMPGNGPQDAEQTLPRFIASGFDFADWVELAAPRPVAIVAFETDFFPIAGATDTFEEAKRFYGLFGAPDAVQLIHGQGGHCNLGPVSPQVFAFLTTHLKGAGAPVATFAPARAKNPDALTVTGDGQVSLALGSLTVEELARRRAVQVAPSITAVASATAVDALRSRIQHDVRALAAVTAAPGGSPKVTAAPRATGTVSAPRRSRSRASPASRSTASSRCRKQAARTRRSCGWTPTPLDDIARAPTSRGSPRPGTSCWRCTRAASSASRRRTRASSRSGRTWRCSSAPSRSAGRSSACGSTTRSAPSTGWRRVRTSTDRRSRSTAPARWGWWRCTPRRSTRGSRASSWSAGWCRIRRRSRPGCTRTCPRC